VTSPRTPSGTPAEAVGEVDALPAASGAIRSSTASAHSRSENGATSSSIFPASIFEEVERCH
jgi:hypothetical protein